MILRVVCAWCRLVMAVGSPAAPTSHSICPTCFSQLEQETP